MRAGRAWPSSSMWPAMDWRPNSSRSWIACVNASSNRVYAHQAAEYTRMGKSRRKRVTRRAVSTRCPPRAALASRIRAFVTGILPVLAIVRGTRQLLAEAFRIPSGSMEPTLLVGDWLFVNKLRFGPHVPFTNYSLPGYATPKRGDVTVFVSPPQDIEIRISPEQVTPMLVKRIVGAAGDTLLMRHGQLM